MNVDFIFIRFGAAAAAAETKRGSAYVINTYFV